MNPTEITHLALFLSVSAIPALFLLPVLCVTLTDGSLILPDTFWPLEILVFFDRTEKLQGIWFLLDPKGSFPPPETS